MQIAGTEPRGSELFTGGALAIGGLVAILVASRAVDGVMEFHALLFVLFCFGGIFASMVRGKLHSC